MKNEEDKGLFVYTEMNKYILFYLLCFTLYFISYVKLCLIFLKKS